MQEVINLTTENLEVPKAFSEAFKEVKKDVEESRETEAQRETPKRGRPRKNRDELEPVKVDTVDEIKSPEEVVEETPAVPEEGKEEQTKTTPQAEEYIPDELVDAGREMGFSDETIRELAGKSLDVLKRAVGKQPTAPVTTPPPAETRPVAPVTNPSEFKVDRDLYGDDLANYMEAQAKELGDLKVAMRQVLTEKNARNIAEQDNKFDTTLDKLSAELPVVGNSSKLAPEQWQTRKMIWDKAETLRRGEPQLKFEDSIEDAVAWYKGKHGEKFMKQIMITKLKAREPHLSYPPTHKQQVEPQFASEEEEAVYRIRKAKERHRP